MPMPINNIGILWYSLSSEDAEISGLFDDVCKLKEDREM